MRPGEGVVKYREEYTPGPPATEPSLTELMVWRSILHDLGLVGQDACRYQGAGFGNGSTRVAPYDRPKGRRAFLVTGTRTGPIARLAPEHFTVVESWDATANTVVVRGPIRASSESLTHGAVYDQTPTIRWIFHAHAPVIWRLRDRLRLPTTRPEVPYGSPEMAQEVWRLFAQTDLRTIRIFAMSGHEDGIVTFGTTAAEAGGRLVDTLARAMVEDGRTR
jgi:ribulose-5-phosphate 4-epimerase/fuculose-1-phosphate aldolase